VRTFGFEEQVFAKGEPMLLIVKAAGLEEDAHGELEEVAVQYDDGSYGTGNTPCRVVDWVAGVHVRVAVAAVDGKEKLLKVPFVERVVRGIAVTSCGLKPFKERVVDLAQGLEWDGVVHVRAAKIFGCGKFYVAITRAKSLSNLKISGVPDDDALRNVVRSNWRALFWLSNMGEHVPEYCMRFVSRKKRMYDGAWAAAMAQGV